MEEQEQGFNHGFIAEQILLAHLITHPSDRWMPALLLTREDFSPVHDRLYSAINLFGVGETMTLGTDLARMLEFAGDREALTALCELASVEDGPTNQLELVKLALIVHDEGLRRVNRRLHDEAVDRWIAKECEDLDYIPPDSEVEW
jgi:hypothetical protein